ncbi:MAG TPA: TIGR02253 family HAD-type hydrolase [Candidatus Lokiarchaeia archaeon]|nr:TIGR02253 family HAD-type hydrolase [Candidatus Lokiarchaeia archaeon]
MPDDKISTIFFDLDDTLFDATGLAQKARRAAIESMIENGLAGVTADEGFAILQEVVKEFGSNYDNHFNMFLKRLDQLSTKLVTVAVITYQKIKLEELKLYPDVFGFLQNLRDNTSCTLGIITDGLPIKQYEKILRLGLDPFFPSVFISEEIGIRKPNPKIYSYALEKTGAIADQSLFIGDRFDFDAIPAKNAGMKTCLIHRNGKHDIDFDEEERTLIDYEVWDLGDLWEQIKGNMG